MVKRFIDAEKMREEWLENGENEYLYDTNAVLDSIDAQPTADVAEVVHGNWIEWWDDNYLTFCHKCSECGKYPLTKEETMHDEVLSKYCPNCGAKMDKGEEENAEIVCSK